MKLRDGTTVKCKLNDKYLHLKNNNNEDHNLYSSQVCAVVNKKKDNNGSLINSVAIAAEK